MRGPLSVLIEPERLRRPEPPAMMGLGLWVKVIAESPEVMGTRGSGVAVERPVAVPLVTEGGGVTLVAVEAVLRVLQERVYQFV